MDSVAIDVFGELCTYLIKSDQKTITFRKGKIQFQCYFRDVILGT